MRLLDETPLDPEIAASLDAIDATLAGDAVAPEHAELAELALMLRAERCEPREEFTAGLDQWLERQLTPAPAKADRHSHRRWWLWTPAAGLAAAVAVAVVIVVGGSGHVSSRSGPYFATGSANSSSPARKGAAAGVAPTGVPLARHRSAAKSLAAAAAPNSLSSSQGSVVQPLPSGRKIVQSGQLSLTTAPSRIDDVAQEVFVAVGQVKGIVDSSTVTATGGPGGYAQFQLSIPSGSMPQAMASLSSLRYARVTSRTDTSQDVNSQYRSDVAKLASDQATRTSLLKQLANAITQGEIDSLTIRLHDINAAISSDQATLQSLNNQIDYSQVNVTINGGTPPPTPVQSGGGFGFHQAAHDAGRVLTVAAGVALIGLAALTPIALVLALAWWIAATLRRRRREQALDLV